MQSFQYFSTVMVDPRKLNFEVVKSKHSPVASVDIQENLDEQCRES